MGFEWPEAIAAPPRGWLVPLGVGLVTILVHAGALSRWTAEAALTEDTGSD
jgi:hypothetical protein